jgi:asparagine synthase (glutamine-hydrolysing)
LLKEEDFENVEDLILEFGEPFADASMLPSYFIAKAISKNTKVALSGDGGDEAFLGYPTYQQGYRMQELYNKLHLLKFALPQNNKIKNSKYQSLQGVLQQNPTIIAKELSRSMGFNPQEVHLLLKGKNTKNAQDYFEDVLVEGQKNYNTIFKSLWFGTFKTRLLNDYLVKIDRSSMFAGLEVRSPFLDDELIDFVAQIDYKKLMPQKQSKYLLKQIANKYLPKQIMQKPKTGFAIPIGEWFRGKWKDKFEQTVLLNKQNVVDLDYDFILKIFNEHLSGLNHTDKLWAIYVFHVWVN